VITPQAIAPLSICIAVETAGQLAFSLAGTQPARRVAWTALGVGLHVILLAAWCWLLLLVPLGIAAPLTGATYLTVAWAGHTFLGERIGRQGWIGLLSIVVGFALIAGR